MNFFRPSVFGYPARPPLSLPPPYTPPLEVGPLAIPASMSTSHVYSNLIACNDLCVSNEHINNTMVECNIVIWIIMIVW